MDRRSLLAGAPAVALGLALPAAAASPVLVGLPLATHYGQLAADALAATEWTQHFDMQVWNGDVSFRNRKDPRDVVIQHLRALGRDAAALQDDNARKWTESVARVTLATYFE